MSNIYAICTTLSAGRSDDRQTIIKNNIQIGDRIKLEKAVVHNWYTEIYLVGYEDEFNSVFFKFVDENGDDYDIYSDLRFQSH